MHQQSWLDADGDLAVGIGDLQTLKNLDADGAQVNLLALELLTRHMGQCQQALDQLAHRASAGLDTGQVMLDFARLLAAELFVQQATEAVQRGQWRAQVM